MTRVSRVFVVLNILAVLLEDLLILYMSLEYRRLFDVVSQKHVVPHCAAAYGQLPV